jgi:DNA mismatch repair protein MutH
MTPLPIDFAPRSPYRLLYRVPFWVWPVLLSGLAITASAGWRLGLLQAKTGDVRQELVAARERIEAPVRRAPVTVPITRAQADAVNNAVRQLNIPWEDLLDALEEASTQNVGLLELRPDAAATKLIGSAEAKTDEDMTGYMRRLKLQPLFTSALLTSHQVNEQDKNRPVRFEFVAVWKDFQ